MLCDNRGDVLLREPLIAGACFADRGFVGVGDKPQR